MLANKNTRLIALNLALFVLGAFFFLRAFRSINLYTPLPQDEDIARYASSNPRSWHVESKAFPNINKTMPVPVGTFSLAEAEKKALQVHAGTEARYMYGLALYQDGQYSAALTVFRAMMPVSQRYYSAYLWAGYAAMGVGDLRTSVDMFGYVTGARRVDSLSHAQIAAEQGNCLWEMGLFDEAGRAYNEARKYNLSNITALIGLTDIALRQDNRRMAAYYLTELDSIPLTNRERSIVALLHQR